MPKLEIDYSNTIIYKITCIEPTITDVYVGHTTNFVQRKYAHKQSCTNQNTANYKCKLYEVIRNNGGWENWKMEIINFYNCHDHYEARKKEQEYFISLNATLNSIEPLPLPKLKSKSKSELKPKLESKDSEDIILTTKSCIQVVDKFSCIMCDYHTSRKSSYDKHILTMKHIATTKSLQNIAKVAKKHTCDCGKDYKHHTSLWNHKQKCKINSVSNNIPLIPQEALATSVTDGSTNQISGELVIELLKQNNEFRELLKDQNKQMMEHNKYFIENQNKQTMEQNKQMLDQNKHILELMEKGIGNTINTNCNNITNKNKFNLNIFLNEQCKDAMNIMDFVNSLQLKLTDLERVGELGYVKGISHIILNKLKALDICKRPIHCSDLKREVIHVKYNDAWVKDEDKKHMKRAIKLIEHKNIKLVPGWLKANPKADDISTKKHEEYMKILDNSMGEMKDEDNERNYEKIIKNVAKEILIDREK